MIRLIPVYLFLVYSASVVAGNATGVVEFKHCYDFGCKSSQLIDFNGQQWIAIKKIFDRPALSPWLEKQQIRLAIAKMEEFSGQMTGTYRDKGGNYPGQDISHQQDCIDESTNTLQYLQALYRRNLLRWHTVTGRQRCMVWFATHWTAVIKENDNDQYFAVDSWYRDNGDPPYIQQLADWQRKSSFSNLLNP